jgi:hypothetical protein
MGVWEDALREAAAQRQEEVAALERQREDAAEQKRVLADFIEAMGRLGVRPQRQPFLLMKGVPELNRYRASLRHKITGWDVGANVVVTPDGSVYDMTDQDREPRDLRRPLVFTDDGSSQTLTELLRRTRSHLERGE